MTFEELVAFATSVRGFLPVPEGRALAAHGQRRGRERPGGTWLEVGAWCGRSTVFLGAAARDSDSVLYSLDHHHGSEEQQAGWEHFEADLVDGADGRINTLPTWQRTVADAGLESVVLGLVGPSAVIAAHFSQPLDLLFLDGGHGEQVAWADYHGWVSHLVTGGLLVIHDVFPDPHDGGRPPYEIYQAALAAGFEEEDAVGSLRVLRRGAPAASLGPVDRAHQRVGVEEGRGG